MLFDAAGAVVLEQGRGDLLQQPVLLFHTGPGGEAGLDQPALVVEAVAGDAMQGAVGVHRVDVDEVVAFPVPQALGLDRRATGHRDRKSTRLNSSHVRISYAGFCLKKKIYTGWR